MLLINHKCVYLYQYKSSVIRNKSLLLKSLKRRNAFLLHTTLDVGKMAD